MSNTGIIERALSSLGKGFDLTSDFRLKFCKGKERIVLLNEAETNELVLPGFGVFKDVSVDIKCDKGDRTRYQSDILEFHQMSEFFNQKSRIAGKIPSGLFNAWFGFEAGSWGRDAENTKYLGIDGYFIIQFNFHIDRFPLVLSDQVLNAVPSSWNPSALARFIEKYGTHVIVGLSIGGHDVVLVRQAKSSKLAPSELKKYLNDLGDQLFTGSCNFSPKTKEQNKLKIPQAFNVFDPQPVSFNSYSTINTKDGITVICHKKGGDLSTNTHAEWLPTVSRNPDAVHFNFIPITSLLKNVPGKGFLSHAINLYLRYKPPISDLESFLDFQYHKIWAPIHSDLPLGPTSNISSASPALQFSMMGPKLHINTSQVVVGKKPITGMRFYLEGMRCNRLAIHLQHLANTPKMLENKIIGDPTQIWRGSEETYETGFYEPVQWKKFSHICTAPIESDLRWSNTSTNNKSYIVTGAQLHVQKHNSKRVLHLRLLFSRVSHSYEVQSTWTQSSSEFSQKSGLFSAISTSISGNPNKNKVTEKKAEVDSSVFPSGPPVPVQTQKLLKYVDTSQICRGPQDSPGHWLVTGAKLDLDKGKICLQVKFSLLAICS